MSHYVKASKRPSTRFNSAVESLVYSLIPDNPVTPREISEIVLGWVAQHPEDGPVRGVREIQLAIENLAITGWLRKSTITPSRVV